MSLEYLNFLVTNDVIIPISSMPLNTKSKRQHNNTNLAMKNEWHEHMLLVCFKHDMTDRHAWCRHRLAHNVNNYYTTLHPFNGPFSRTTQASRYQNSKTNLDFTEARDSEWQWHQLGHMQVCTSHQTDNHASTSPFSFFTGRMPFLSPKQQHQSTEGITQCKQNVVKKFWQKASSQGGGTPPTKMSLPLGVPGPQLTHGSLGQPESTCK